MAGLKDAFMLLVVLVMLGLAGYLTDIMRSNKSHQESTLEIFIMKNGQQACGRMRLTEEQIEGENRVNVANLNGMIVSGRETDRKSIVSNREQVLKVQSIGKQDDEMRDIEFNEEQEMERVDRQVGNVIWSQGSIAADAQRKSLANNSDILQRAVKEAIQVQSKMNEKHMQATQELENLSAQMANHTIQSTGETKKKLEKLKLDEEHARRAKEAAEGERRKAELEERKSRIPGRAIIKSLDEMGLIVCFFIAPVYFCGKIYVFTAEQYFNYA